MAPAPISMTPPDTSSPPPSRRQLLPGIISPTPCFFLPNEDVDLATVAEHAVRLAHCGLAGITVQGTTGEAVHLSHSERILVTRTARKALDDAGFADVPVIVGCGAQSTRETVQLCCDAYEAGGDYALVLPPSYFAASYSRDNLRDHFLSVADLSPVPLLIYSFPAVSAGIDLDSDFLTELSRHPNVVGVKLTCGNIGKLTRLASATSSSSKTKGGAIAVANGTAKPFFCYAGNAELLVPSLFAGSAGSIAGLANVAPKACVACYKAFLGGELEAAHEMQSVLARAEWALSKQGIPGMKAAMQLFQGTSDVSRRPLGRLSNEESSKLAAELAEVMALEKAL